MGGKKGSADRGREVEPRKRKEVCCEKYLKKGKRCKDCPQAGLPVTKAEDKRR